MSKRYIENTREPREECMWCPLCDCNAEDCVQPEGEEQDNGDGVWMEVYWVEGHAARWETCAEKRWEEIEEGGDYQFDAWRERG